MVRMKKKDLLLILFFVLLAAVLLVLGVSSRSSGNAVQTMDEDIPQSSGTEEQSTGATDAVQTYISENYADSYLLLKTANNVYAPIPLNEENSFKITLRNGDYNTVHIGENSFYMEDSNCENQDCVKEGTVTLENMHTRVLYNMIICLPHQLSLEMITREEAQEILYELYEQRLDSEEIMDESAEPGQAEDGD